MKKPKPDPRVKQFIDYAFQTYKAEYGVGLVITIADAACVKRVLGTLDDLELLKRYWDFFLHYRGKDFILKDATRDLKTFCSLINRIVQLNPKPRLDQRPERTKPRKVKNPQAQKLWTEALKYIKSKIHRESFDTWFARTQGYNLKGKILQIAVPEIFFANWITENYADLISEALGGREFELVITETGE